MSPRKTTLWEGSDHIELQFPAGFRKTNCQSKWQYSITIWRSLYFGHISVGRYRRKYFTTWISSSIYSDFEKHRRNGFRIYINIRGSIVSRSAVHPIFFRLSKWELSAYWTDKVVTRSTWVECLSRTGKYGTASEQPCFARATTTATAPSRTSSNYSSSSVF